MDFNYHQKAVDLDRRLEKVIADEATNSKGASSPEDAPIGLQAYIERATIDEEIAAARSKAAADESDLNVIRAREKVASIVEERSSRFDSFSAMAKPVVEEVTKTAAAQAEIDNHRAALLGSVTTERS